MTTIIDALYKENERLLDHLAKSGEISLVNHASDVFRKMLLLSIASYFESRIVDSIVSIVEEYSAGTEPILAFVKSKAIERQYHTYFQWSGKNANSFFGLFGTGFRDLMRDAVRNSTDLDESIRAFLEIGELRNQLAHQNFAIFAMEKTSEEIYVLYQAASQFVEQFPGRLNGHCKAARMEPSA